MRKVEHCCAGLEYYVQRMSAAVRRELIVEIGEPGILILAIQQRFGADLVVMGTHGRRDLKHLVLDSVAEHIVHESTVPG